MTIKIKQNGVKVKVKITSYELFKLNLTPEQLTELLKTASGIKNEICNNK
jgi:hypothetical protein